MQCQSVSDVCTRVLLRVNNGDFCTNKKSTGIHRHFKSLLFYDSILVTILIIVIDFDSCRKYYIVNSSNFLAQNGAQNF